MLLLSIFLATLATILAVPVATFVIEVTAALILPLRDSINMACRDNSLRVAILVPAHNENSVIGHVIADIKAQMHGSDRLLVVADNCTDDTAAVAAAAGAEVALRNEPDKRGKGFALACGMRYLSGDPPDIVIIVDADCRLAESAIDRLAVRCTATRRPVQARYIMRSPEGPSVNYRAAELAWRVRNWVRPLGLRALGLPCQLMGSGMAFPWDLLRSVDLATGSIVEDLQLGLNLATGGNAPVFCPNIDVTSQFPQTVEGSRTQRLRWEQGHVGIIVTMVPRLILTAIRRGDIELLAMTLDVAVPPLSMLVMLLLGISLAGGLAILFGASPVAMMIGLVTLAALSAALVMCWLRCGRDILPSRAVGSLLVYLMDKLPVYRHIISRRRSSWIRTDRRRS